MESPGSFRLSLPWLVLLLLLEVRPARADAPPEAATAFDGYARGVEARLVRQHAERMGFLAADTSGAPEDALRIERVDAGEGSGAGAGFRIDHWRGTAFVAGATAAEFEQQLRDVAHYPATYAPEVERASLDRRGEDRRGADGLATTMRVRQHHVLTVVMDASYDVAFGRRDPAHGYSLSRSTRITEIDSPGTPRERPLAGGAEHGFLWRLNVYWSWEEREGGLAIQVETVSLSRDVPRGLHWLVGPYVESIPRESLAFTLNHAAEALRQTATRRNLAASDRTRPEARIPSHKGESR